MPRPEESAPVVRLLLPPPRPFGRILESLRRQGYGVEGRTPSRWNALFADTGDGRLFRRGARLRLLRTADHWSWSYGEPGSEEVTQEVPGETYGPPGWPVMEVPPGPAGNAARAAAGPRALIGLLRSEVHEVESHLASPSGARIGLLVQRFRSSPARGGPTASGTLVTLTLLDGGRDSLAHLAGYLGGQRGLLPAGGDLLEEGLKALGLKPPGSPPPEALAVRLEDPLQAAARKTLARLALKLEENLEGTVRGWDDEFLHDMRVATRRLRSALRLFATDLGATRAEALRNDLRWLGGLLGAVRDLDVFLAELAPRTERSGASEATVVALRSHLESLREARRTVLSKALQGARYPRILRRIESLARPRVRRYPPSPPVAVGAPPLVERVLRKALRGGASLGPESPPETFHRLRILFKRARYAAEFFKDALGEPLPALIAEAVAFQDLLGAHQDCQVAAERLRHAAESLHAEGRLDLRGAMDLGALVQVYLEESRRRRRESLRRWERRGKALRKFRKEVRRRAPVGEADETEA